MGIMLLIACAKVASLLLARYSSRGYEFSVRIAIGASRGQIVRQLLAENLVLSGMGAIGGILFASLSLRPMLNLVPAVAGLPFADQVRVSPQALILRVRIEPALLHSASRPRARHLAQAPRSTSRTPAAREAPAGRVLSGDIL